MLNCGIGQLGRYPDIEMCRYAFSGPYKYSYACFKCRKAFKQPSIEDWSRIRGTGFAIQDLWRVSRIPELLKQRELELGVTLSQIEADYKNAAFKCPECGQTMADLGRDFKPPRQTNKKAWETIEKIYVLGHAFHSCGCHGPGFIPATKSEYLQYLQLKRREYVDHAIRCEALVNENIDDNHEAVRYWRQRVETIDAAISNAG